MKLLKQILPQLWVSILLLVVPIGLTIYFFVTQYSNKFLLEQNVDYYQIQNGFVRSLLFDNKLTSFMTRSSDFIFWGVVAAVALLIAWFFSVAKTTAQNHNTVEGFENFQTNAAEWHRHFVVEIVVRILLFVVGVYMLVLCAFTLAPELVTAVAAQLSGESDAIVRIFLLNLYTYIALFVAAVCYKNFRHIQLD